MKVTKWWKKLSAAIVAAGIWLPSMAYAIDIPLGDPSFEVYVVPDYATGGDGFAYAQPNPAYGYTGVSSPDYWPPSAWVDDLDSPFGSTQDDLASNWIYETAYGESSALHRRAAPRTGDQAMHTLGHYSVQETSAVFEADTTYTFSVWAQGDIDATVAPLAAGTSRIFLYIFDGSVSFSEPNSLIFQRFAPDTGDFVNRGPLMTTAESIANWTKISLNYYVAPGSPVIGNPIGVAFWGGPDGAVEDATLSAVPEPTTMILVGLGGLSLLGLSVVVVKLWRNATTLFGNSSGRLPRGGRPLFLCPQPCAAACNVWLCDRELQ